MSKDYEDRGAYLGILIAVEAEKVVSMQGIFPAHVADIVGKMRAYAKQAKRAAENLCSYNVSARTETMYANREKRQEAEINEWFVEHSLGHIKFELGGDPRGPCARLHIEGVRGDGWGDGFPVY